MHYETTTYDQLQATLDLAGLELRASEVHGMVCGEICRQLKLGHDPEFAALLGILESGDGAGRELLKTVDNLMTQSRRSLDAGMEFSLLVPDDDESLAERTHSLADWARGFSLALLRGEQLTLDNLDDNSAEIVQDLLKIGEARPGEESEEDEKALAEIEEYMRVGVQLVFEELHPDEYSDPGQSVH